MDINIAGFLHLQVNIKLIFSVESKMRIWGEIFRNLLVLIELLLVFRANYCGNNGSLLTADRSEFNIAI